MKNDIERVLITEEELREKVSAMGAQISRDFEGKDPLFVGVLKGCFIFMADLLRCVDIHCSMDFMAVSSYSGVKSTGTVRINKDLSEDIAGRHIIIVEDILDTGCTLSHVSEMLKRRGAASVEIATFAIKDLPDVERPVSARYIGTYVPNEFVVGYGLDYAERYRNLPYVGILKPEVYA
jgi:hypoxanthine phosphoribosyltransferase